MESLSNHRVLVLNKNWVAVGVISIQRAISLLFGQCFSKGKVMPKAKIISPDDYSLMEWSDWSKIKPKDGDSVIHTSNNAFKIPEVIVLSKYEKFPNYKVRFSRRAIYTRDNYTCQYCGIKPPHDELSVDHIIPRAKGGTSTWNNCTLSCVSCNRKKGAKSLEESGMKLLSVPHKPNFSLVNSQYTVVPKSWSSFMDIIYWNAELESK